MGIQWRPDREPPHCVHCGKILTAEEDYFYETGCEDCDTDILDAYLKERQSPPNTAKGTE